MCDRCTKITEVEDRAERRSKAPVGGPAATPSTLSPADLPKAPTGLGDLCLDWFGGGILLLIPLGIFTLIMGFTTSWTTAWQWDAKLTVAYWGLFLVVSLIKVCGPLRRLLAALFGGLGKVLGWALMGIVAVITVLVMVAVPLVIVGGVGAGLAGVAKGVGWLGNSWAEGVQDMAPEPEPEEADPVCLDWKNDGNLVCLDPGSMQPVNPY
ncbi:hypothetical protein [Kineococcus radiotolerans]|nr:hypothetical protein [Kineococcus radiotolerans]